MEAVQCKISPEDFDKAVHSGLKEGGDLTFFVKPHATEGKRPAVCVTFTVELPDGTHARAQCVTTLANMMSAFTIFKGWESGGHLK